MDGLLLVLQKQRSGDHEALRRKTTVRNMRLRLSELVPVRTWTHKLRRSSLGNFGVFYELDAAVDLQVAS